MLAEFHIIRPAGSARNAAGTKAGTRLRDNGGAPLAPRRGRPAPGSHGSATSAGSGARSSSSSCRATKIARAFAISAVLTHAVCSLYAGSVVPSHWPAMLLMAALFFIAPCIACAIAAIEGEL